MILFLFQLAQGMDDVTKLDWQQEIANVLHISKESLLTKDSEDLGEICSEMATHYDQVQKIALFKVLAAMYGHEESTEFVRGASSAAIKQNIADNKDLIQKLADKIMEVRSIGSRLAQQTKSQSQTEYKPLIETSHHSQQSDVERLSRESPAKQRRTESTPAALPVH